MTFSELDVLDKNETPFSNTFRATSESVLTDYMSVEALVHKPKRALALTSLKLVRLIFALLRNNQLYTSNEVVEKATI